MIFSAPATIHRLAVCAVAGLMALGLSACSDSSHTTTGIDAGSAAPVVSTETTGSIVSTAMAAEVPTPDGTVDMAAVMAPGPLKDMAMGSQDAPVTIVEYMSMTCPHCADFHANTLPVIKENYVDTGKVRLIVREFPFDPRAAAAVMLARCAPEDQFFPMVQVLLEQQSTWATAQDAVGALLQIARLAGFTQETFQTCLTNQQLLDDVNAVRNRAASEFGVQSTPTFLINGNRYSGNMSVEDMSALIDSLL